MRTVQRVCLGKRTYQAFDGNKRTGIELHIRCSDMFWQTAVIHHIWFSCNRTKFVDQSKSHKFGECKCFFFFIFCEWQLEMREVEECSSSIFFQDFTQMSCFHICSLQTELGLQSVPESISASTSFTLSSHGKRIRCVHHSTCIPRTLRPTHWQTQIENAGSFCFWLL